MGQTGQASQGPAKAWCEHKWCKEEQSSRCGAGHRPTLSLGDPTDEASRKFPRDSPPQGISITFWVLPTHIPPGAHSHLAFERLYIRVDDHVCLEGLFLHKTLVAEVTLVGANVGVDQHVSLHVGQQSELPPANSAFVLLHALEGSKIPNMLWLAGNSLSFIRIIVFIFLFATQVHEKLGDRCGVPNGVALALWIAVFLKSVAYVLFFCFLKTRN